MRDRSFPPNQVDPVAPARRSSQGDANASAQRANTGHDAHTLTDLLADLATLCHNTLTIHNGATFTRLTQPTDIHATALALLNVKLVT